MPKILISKAFSFFIFYCFVIDKWHNISGDKDGNLLWEPYKYNNPDNAYTGKAD